MSKKHIIKSAGIIGFATVISRILGFVRDIIIARFFGTARYAEAFVVAFRIPNMLRDLVGEGATNAAFVPVLSEYLVNKKEELVDVCYRCSYTVSRSLVYIADSDHHCAW